VGDSGGSSGGWLPYFLIGNFDMRRRQLACRTLLEAGRLEFIEVPDELLM
jgi:hypothetical protein